MQKLQLNENCVCGGGGLPLNNLKNFSCGHVRKCVMFSIEFWTMYLYDLAQII